MSEEFREIWEKNFRLYSSKNFISFGTIQWTYREFVNEVLQTAEALSRYKTIGLAVPNGLDFVRVFFAALIAGKTICPLNPNLGSIGCDQIMKKAKIDVLIVPEKPSTAWHQVDVGLYRFTRIDTTYLLKQKKVPFEPSFDGRVIIYTSGTTGESKGVLLKIEHFLAEAEGFSKIMGLTKDDFALNFLPLSHIFALALGLFTPWYLGASVALLPHFSTQGFWEVLNKYPITHFTTVPTVLIALLAKPIPSFKAPLKFAISGAAPLAEKTLTQWEKQVCSICEGYGLSETTSAVTVNPANRPHKINSVGIPLLGVSIAILSEKDELLAPNECGEVVLRGPMVITDYHRRTISKVELFWEDESGEIWLRTGDIGLLDKDGYLFLVDRKKDVINRGGEKIYPKEIERVLVDYPGILDVSIVGIPDDFYGEIPIAFIILRDPEFSDYSPIKDYLQTLIAEFKMPVHFFAITELPRNPNGKIQKDVLRKLAIELSSK